MQCVWELYLPQHHIVAESVQPEIQNTKVDNSVKDEISVAIEEYLDGETDVIYEEATADIWASTDDELANNESGPQEGMKPEMSAFLLQYGVDLAVRLIL